MAWFNIGKENKELKMQQEFLTEFQGMLTNAAGLDDSIRSRFSNLISGGYDFSDILHQIFEDFGYPETLTFSNYWNMYRRFGVAQAVCEIPVDFTWMTLPEVKGGEAFDAKFKELAEQIKLWKRIKGADNRQRVGRYSGLFIRARDGKKPNEPVETLNGVKSIMSATPVYEGQLLVSKTEQDEQSENFGNPTMYDFNGTASGSTNEEAVHSFQIHASRIIPFAEGADDGSIYGKSSLESIFNDLMDLRKISGAGGEGFYQNTRNAPIINTKENYEAPKGKQKVTLEKELDEFLNKWRKKFVATGLEFQYPDITLDNPKEFYNNPMNNVSAGSKIPTKLIIGNQQGNLASEEDGKHFLSLMNSRNENYGTESIEDVINWFVKYNVLPQPVNLTVEFEDLLARSDEDRIELSKKMSETNKNQFQAGGEHVFSIEQMAEIAGFELEKIDLPSEEDEDDDDLDKDVE